MFTDSKRFLDVIVNNCTPSERHLMIDNKDIRETYETQKISKVVIVRS